MSAATTTTTNNGRDTNWLMPCSRALPSDVGHDVHVRRCSPGQYSGPAAHRAEVLPAWLGARIRGPIGISDPGSQSTVAIESSEDTAAPAYLRRSVVVAGLLVAVRWS